MARASRVPDRQLNIDVRPTKMKTALLLTLLVLPMVCLADDIRGYVAGGEEPELSRVIEPDKAIFGIPYGTTEDDFIKRIGKPMGYLRITATETAMIYGRKYLFLFDNGKLSGVRVAHGILDSKIAQLSTYSSVFDRLRWKLDIGLGEESSLVEAKRLLGDKLKSDQYGFQRYYETDKARVDLDLWHRTDLGDGDDAYTLGGVFVRLK